MSAPSFRVLFPRAVAAFFLLLNGCLAFADEPSSVLASEESFFQFACTVDQLVLQDKEAEIAPLIQKTIPEGPVRNAFLARLQVLLLDQKLHKAITRRREKYELGVEAARQLFKSLKAEETVKSSVQALKDLHEQHPKNQQICYLVASGMNRHAAVAGREMMRMIDVMDPGKSNDLMKLFAEHLCLMDSVALAKTVIDQMQISAPRNPATRVCSGMLRNLMNPSDGAEVILDGLQEAPRFPFALIHVLENLDINGIGKKDHHFMILVTTLVAQGEAAEAMLNSAKAKFNDDHKTASTGYQYTAGLGFPSPRFADKMSQASAMIECCNLLSGTTVLMRSQQTQQNVSSDQ